jgi:hypothetical protein
VGFGRLRFGGAPPEGCALVAMLPEGEVAYEPGRELRVAAGVVQLRATGALGRREVAIEIPRDDVAEVDPAACCAAGLSLHGAPAGAVLRLRREEAAGLQDERVVAVPSPPDSLDVETGIWLAGPLEIGALEPGLLRLVVEHPVLGSHTLQLELLGGSALRFDLDPGLMPRTPRVREAFRRHRRGQEVRFAVGLAISMVAAGALGAASGALWHRAHIVGSSTNDLRSAAIRADDLHDPQGTRERFDVWEPSLAHGRELVAGGGITTGFAVLASGFAVAISVDFGRRRSSWSGWDPAIAVGEGTSEGE